MVVDRNDISNMQNNYSFRYQATDLTPDVGGQVYIWGAQAEVNTMKPGTYVHTINLVEQ